VTPGFDNSARKSASGAAILSGSSPEAYGQWLRAVIDRFEPYGPEEDFIFVNAWNEWAEGNHLEPCQRWGRGYLDVHAAHAARPRTVAAAASASVQSPLK
jgi:hypothetical protein